MSWKAGFLACAGCFLSIYLGIKGILLIPDESFAYTSGLTGNALVALLLGSILGVLFLVSYTPRPFRGLRMYVYIILGFFSTLVIVYILFAFVVTILSAIATLILAILIRERKPKNIATRFIAFLGSADVGES